MASILVADSGSTKTHWQWAAAEEASYFGEGFNPMTMSAEKLRERLQEAAKALPAQDWEYLYFYGAGCAEGEAAQLMRVILAEVFPSCKNIEVRSDIWAAIRATAGEESAVVCILGTGSNSCLFNGNSDKISAQIPALGYLLGDEGGGVMLGRRLLQCYFYGLLPAELHSALQGYAPDWLPASGDSAALLWQVYKGEGKPNEFIASFARFLAEHKENAFVEKLVEEVLRPFLQERVQPYFSQGKAESYYRVHFIGSIAYTWQHLLRPLCRELGLHCGHVHRSPFPTLWRYHVGSR